jgi:hypothetical protein
MSEAERMTTRGNAILASESGTYESNQKKKLRKSQLLKKKITSSINDAAVSIRLGWLLIVATIFSTIKVLKKVEATSTGSARGGSAGASYRTKLTKNVKVSWSMFKRMGSNARRTIASPDLAK